MAELTKLEKTQKTIEERLQPWIDQGEYVIVLVIGLMAYAAGWVDLLGFQSPQNPVVFDRYSIPFFAVLVAYTLGFSVWFWLIGSLAALALLKRVISFIQRNPLIYVLVWLLFTGMIWSMFNVSYWIALPLLEVAVLVMMVLFTATVLLATPYPGAPFQTWRKAALVLIGALILFELILQGLASAKALPLENTTGVTTAYGRVYQNVQGFGNGTTNSFGWYYPEFRLAPESRRIILSGDTFVQAVQIPMEQHMGIALERFINADTSGNTEVLAQGQVGYGPTMFINPLMFSYLWEPMQPDEIVVFFHLANDFQVNDPSVDPRPRYELDANGDPVVVDEDFAKWHYLAHLAIAGHDPPNPVRTISSNLLSMQVLDAATQNLFGYSLNRPDFPLNIERLSEGEPFGPASYAFETDGSEARDRAFSLVAAQLRTFAAYLSERGIQLRLVTIPFFPEAFYESGAGSGWAAEMGQYDILLPERHLQSVAAEYAIPFLGMGQYMRAADMTAEQVQSLYFANGQGHLTEEGHAVFAQALYDCFYHPAAELSGDSGCVVASR